MASLGEDFDREEDLSAAFDREENLATAFDAEPEAIPAAQDVAPNSRGSFLDFLKAKLGGEETQPADVSKMPGVKTVQTPTGVTHVDAFGRPVYTAEESRQMLDSGSAKAREDALKGSLSFLSGGAPMLDEAKGALEAYRPSKVLADLAGSGDDPFKRYVRERDSARSEIRRATDDVSPTATVMGQRIPLLPVAGAVASSAGAGIPETLLGRLGLGATLGAGSGFWNSEADNAGDMALDTGVGAGVGLVSAGAAEVPGAIARGGTSLMQRGAVKQMSKDLTDAAAKAQSALGTAGSAGGRVGRIIKLIDDVEANPAAYDQPTIAYAKALATDPEVVSARSRIALNAMKGFRSADSFEKQMAQEAGDLMSTIPQRAQAATDEALSSPYLSALLPRAERFGTRAAVGATGEAIAGATGGAVAAAPGSVQMVLNMSRDPRLQYAVGRDVSRVAGLAGNPARASVAGSEAVTANKNAYRALMERFGISAKSKEELADEAFLLGQQEPELQNGR